MTTRFLTGMLFSLGRKVNFDSDGVNRVGNSNR